MKEIEALENGYGLVLFRMAITHLIDVGVRNFNDDSVEEGIRQITATEEANKANGIVTLMTPELQCGILRCAFELSKFSIWDLLLYVKKYVHMSD